MCLGFVITLWGFLSFFFFFEIRRLILMLGCVPLRWGLLEQLG